MNKKRRLEKSSNDIVLTGVCGGIAEYSGVSPFFVRVVFIIFQPAVFWIYVFFALSLKDAKK